MAVGIVLVMAGVAAPCFRARFADAHILGAGAAVPIALPSRLVDRRPHAASTRASGSSAWDDGRVFYSVYSDGNANGVRSADIDSGVDRRISGPYPLSGGAPSVRVGINPGVPNLPPETGELSGDPVRFGQSDILSFSPLGTATPGTFYLAGDCGPGRRARQRRHRARPTDAVARRALAGAVTTTVLPDSAGLCPATSVKYSTYVPVDCWVNGGGQSCSTRFG